MIDVDNQVILATCVVVDGEGLRELGVGGEVGLNDGEPHNKRA